MAKTISDKRLNEQAISFHRLPAPPPTALAPARGSLQQWSVATGQPLARTMLRVNACIIVDCSGSMTAQDAPGGRTRYDFACQELATLQADLPGKIALFGFHDECVFCANGQLPKPILGTNLTGALNYCKRFDLPGMKIILISDGEPNDAYTALQAARGYRNRIDTIFVGARLMPPSDGERFLTQIAMLRNGESVTCDRLAGLLPAMQRLLLTTNRVN